MPCGARKSGRIWAVCARREAGISVPGFGAQLWRHALRPEPRCDGPRPPAPPPHPASPRPRQRARAAALVSRCSPRIPLQPSYPAAALVSRCSPRIPLQPSYPGSAARGAAVAADGPATCPACWRATCPTCRRQRRTHARPTLRQPRAALCRASAASASRPCRPRGAAPRRTRRCWRWRRRSAGGPAPRAASPWSAARVATTCGARRGGRARRKAA